VKVWALMKKWLRRVLLASIIFIVVMSVLPFLIPIREDGIEAQTLVTDADGAFIMLQSANVYYEDKGNPSDPAIVLLHGLFGSTETWRYNVDALVEAGYRVVTFDRLGFGLSDKDSDLQYSVNNQADMTAELMDALNIEQAIIVGHSAGGNVAAYFAVRHPERVRALVLVDAAVLVGGPPSFVGGIVSLPPVWRWARIGLQAFFTRKNFESTLRNLYVDPSFLTPADFDTYWRAFQTQGWDVGLLGLTRDGAGNLLTETQIKSIAMPTLIIWGDSDTVTPVAHGRTLNEWIDNSTLNILPNMGHQPFEEDPQAFNEALLSYLSTLN
jgi:pimeloyl-ACP methyl ester carboxylesterase